ncbi:MAG: Rid family detoxifying hydrolase [Candidatus Sabulitectum sp.]|nr:Rid family detoxifying hydrolase [Candidatus Sabulitectum sp.]
MVEKIKTAVFSREAAEPVGPYSQAVLTGSLVFISGQLGMDLKTGKLSETVEEQTRLALESIEKIIAEAGGCLDDIVKTTVLLADMSDFAAMNRAYSEFFKQPYPARAAFQVAKLPLNARVEIEAVARLKER